MSSPVGEIKVGMAPRAVAFSADGLFAYVLNDQDFTIAKVDMTPFFDMPQMNQKQLGVQESVFVGPRRRSLERQVAFDSSEAYRKKASYPLWQS